ncbi:MAG: protein kinase [Planctomycetota bacterium]|nr:protein kinase [Planctomycetota bacterium]
MAESPLQKSSEHDPESNSNSAQDARAYSELPTGSGLGKYRILERIRKTHHAVIYKARDSLLDRLVGLKQMSPGLIDDPVACGEFRREAQMMARCGRSSRHVIGIHELIGDDHGLFIVQDHLQGRWLESLISKRQLDASHTLRAFGTIAIGLRAIHALGIIHRDIRPSNIVFDAKAGAIIADLFSAAPEGDSGVPYLPTRKYTAPELLLEKEYDDRVDVYSLGMILFEMCVGRAQLDHHFSDLLSDPRGADDGWMAWHTDYNKPLPRASELNPSVPQSLSTIIDKATSKGLDDRYSSIDEMIAALSRLMKTRRRQSAPQLPAPMPIRHVGPEQLHSTPRLPRLGMTGPDSGGATSPLSSANRETTTHQVAWADGSRTTIATATTETAEQPAPVSTTRVSAKDKPARRQQAVVRRHQTVTADSIPTPESVEESLKPEGRKWLVAAGVASVIAVALFAAGAIGWYRYWGPGAAHEIQNIFAAGLTAYDDHRFVLAREKFLQAARTPASGRFAKVRDKAERWVLLSEAREALHQKNYARAHERLAIAENRGADSTQMTAIRQLLDSRIRRNELTDQIEAAIARGDTAILDTLREPDGLVDSDLTMLRNRIADSRAWEQTRNRMENARAALGAGEYAAALMACREAQLISDTVEVRDLVRQIKNMEKRDEWVRRGNVAMVDQKYDFAVDAFDRANRLQPDSMIERKAGMARAYVLFGEALVAMEDGDPLLAERKLKNALWNGRLPKAVAKLHAWKPAFTAARVAFRADRAMKSGDFKQAIRLYKSALPQLPAPADAVVRAKLAVAERNATKKRRQDTTTPRD